MYDVYTIAKSIKSYVALEMKIVPKSVWCLYYSKIEKCSMLYFDTLIGTNENCTKISNGIWTNVASN